MRFAENFFLFTALLNPVSKMLVMAGLAREHGRRELLGISFRSTIAAAVILLSFAAGGVFVLGTLLHVDLYSLKVVGGVVLFATGFRALEKGRFIASDEAGGLQAATLVPLASPLIAGPASITASISIASIEGVRLAWLVICAALGVNFLAMTVAPSVSRALDRFNLMGPLIRITGMLVMALGTQMGFAGLGEWWERIAG